MAQKSSKKDAAEAEDHVFLVPPAPRSITGQGVSPRPGPSSAQRRNGPAQAPANQLSRIQVRREYSELIGNCQEYENKMGLDSEMDEFMSSYIDRGMELFHKIGGGPGDMLLAFMHTRQLTSMIKYKAESIGSDSSGFRIEEFFEALKELVQETETQTGENLEDKTVQLLSIEAGNCMRTLPNFVSLVGSFDRDLIQVPKVKKERAKPSRAKKFDPSEATKHEEINLAPQGSKKVDTTSSEHKSKEIHRIMKREYTNRRNTPLNLVKFTLERDSIAKTIENLFCVSFLVRDGHAAVTSSPETAPENAEILEKLVLKPEIPPAVDKTKPSVENEKRRNQLIVSFSSQMWKDMTQRSNVPSIISQHTTKKSTTSSEK